MTEQISLLLAAAHCAADVASEVLRIVREEDVDDGELLDRALDCVKCLIEAAGDFTDDRGQVYSAIVKYLEGTGP
jgi:hypothetical protein